MSMVGHDSTEKSIVSFISKYVATRNLLYHVSRSARNYCALYFGFREEWVPISMRSEMISNTTEQLHSPRSDKEKKTVKQKTVYNKHQIYNRYARLASSHSKCVDYKIKCK